jgi:hypothetical protein
MLALLCRRHINAQVQALSSEEGALHQSLESQAVSEPVGDGALINLSVVGGSPHSERPSPRRVPAPADRLRAEENALSMAVRMGDFTNVPSGFPVTLRDH